MKMGLMGQRKLPSQEERSQGLAAIRETGEIIARTREADPLLKLFVRSLMEKFEYHRVLLVERQREEFAFLFKEGGGFSDGDLSRIRQAAVPFLTKLFQGNQRCYWPAESPQRKEIEALFQCASLAAVPVGREWFLLAGKTLPNNPVTPDDVEILHTLAIHLGDALEKIEFYQALVSERDQLKRIRTDLENHAKMVIRANLELSQKEEKLSRKVSGFSVLQAIGEMIGKTHEIKELMELVIESLVMRLDYDRGLIVQIRGRRLVLEVHVGFSVQEVEKIEECGGTFLSKIMEKGKAVLVTSRQEKQIEELLGCTSAIMIPLREQEFLIAGKRVVYDAMTLDDLELLTILGSQVRIGIENVVLYEQLRQERDQLQQAKKDLEEWSQILEQRVEERTKKLQEAQEHLLRAGKLAAVGQLGAGVAHELNNPMGAVMGYAQLAREKTDQIDAVDLKQQISRYLQTIEAESQRCKRIIDSLLRFSRGGIHEKPIFQPTSIREVLQNTFSLTQHQLEMHRVKIRQEIDPDLPLVQGDGNQLQQVFTNIVLNADQAMPKGGELWVTARKSLEKSGMVAVSFKDTGCGIEPEYLDKIFDPFFTTKPIGQGTGLGLSISYGIIQDHRGEIKVESKPNKGATFTVYLPAEAA